MRVEMEDRSSGQHFLSDRGGTRCSGSVRGARLGLALRGRQRSNGAAFCPWSLLSRVGKANANTCISAKGLCPQSGQTAPAGLSTLMIVLDFPESLQSHKGAYLGEVGFLFKNKALLELISLSIN